MRVLSVLVWLAVALAAGAVGAGAGEPRIRGRVRRRMGSRRHRAALPPCRFNETLIDDEWALMEAIQRSKYIFTGKVLNVKKFRPDDDSGKRSNLYKVLLRRVLKGEPSELRRLVKDGGPGGGGGALAAERRRARESCAPAPRARLSAVFLSGGVLEAPSPRRGPTPRLLLLTDPVPLTLYHLDRINAAVKGNNQQHTTHITNAKVNIIQIAPTHTDTSLFSYMYILIR
ncbi:hypothetical protein JYU34_003421 [Plutella xylostella]|uniref:Uncharacterized protein n=1 Tax=Plutella xylostella TaxID=51655 RepID=A0ABQ7R001_PLUXY|nr:hypothetical protein JYU34_003421 [Plutella xylostella]